MDEAIVRQRHMLAEWCGLGPNELGALLPALHPVKGAAVPASLPADLIGRRADLVAQRLRVESTLAGVEAARAQFYPNVNLMAFAGLSSLGLDRFIDLGSRTYGIGPAVRLPIFDGGALKANLAMRQADVEQAIDAYNGTLLRALREVADETSTLQSVRLQRESQLQALSAAQSAHQLAQQRYGAGLGNYLMVLSVETDYINQRRAQIDLKARELSAELGLVRALGGGYQEASR
jgi:NodT family efflux transporter outer membrane factor (OMF) lipoprotein